MRHLRRAFIASALGATALLGCELIVSSTVPDFNCTANDKTSCPANMICSPQTLTCVDSNGVEGGSNEGSTTDARADAHGDGDIDPGTSRIGEHCDKSAPCPDFLVCVSSTQLTTSIVTEEESICARTCCVSSDCPDGFVCFGAGTGGNYCIAAAKAQRKGLGAKTPGVACTDNTQCRSGVCGDDEHCLDTCCAATDCAAGTTCRVKSIATPPPARENWVCAQAEDAATLNVGGSCSGTTATCKNDNCSGFPQKCRPPCCSNEQCAAIGSSFSFCAYGDFSTTGSKTKWCFDKVDGGAGRELGAACTGNGDCLTRFCDPDFKTCGKVCCQDSDCGDGALCRPSGSGTPLLRCVAAK